MIESSGQNYDISVATRNAFYVPQGNSVFAGTIADNLPLTIPDATEAELDVAHGQRSFSHLHYSDPPAHQQALLHKELLRP